MADDELRLLLHSLPSLQRYQELPGVSARASPKDEACLRVAVTGPARRDVLNALLRMTLFPATSELVTEVYQSDRLKVQLVGAAGDAGNTEEYPLEANPDFKVLQRMAYLTQTLEALAQHHVVRPELRRMRVYYPYVSPLPNASAVILTDDEDISTADVVFSTRAGEMDEVTVFGPTGICRNMRPRHALVCYLAGIESDSTRYFDRFVKQVLSKALLQAANHRAGKAAESDRILSERRQTVEGLKTYATELLRLCDRLGPPDGPVRDCDSATQAGPCGVVPNNGEDGCSWTRPTLLLPRVLAEPWQPPKVPEWHPHTSEWQPTPSKWMPREPDWRPKMDDDEALPAGPVWQPRQPEWKPKESTWQPRESDWQPPAGEE